ncbi:hypothetical protein L226DRAFT_527770, partial [Lentinus tigrinus ALCF2SS1-7]|uniref:uncharacterized protein n=1 Tax=Lentinus tigrinus ALCF2SS1-7 TaxID=1328758 RepID=UPI001165EC5D
MRARWTIVPQSAKDRTAKNPLLWYSQDGQMGEFTEPRVYVPLEMREEVRVLLRIYHMFGSIVARGRWNTVLKTTKTDQQKEVLRASFSGARGIALAAGRLIWKLNFLLERKDGLDPKDAHATIPLPDGWERVSQFIYEMMEAEGCSHMCLDNRKNKAKFRDGVEYIDPIYTLKKHHQENGNNVWWRTLWGTSFEESEAKDHEIPPSDGCVWEDLIEAFVVQSLAKISSTLKSPDDLDEVHNMTVALEDVKIKPTKFFWPVEGREPKKRARKAPTGKAAKRKAAEEDLEDPSRRHEVVYKPMPWRRAAATRGGQVCGEVYHDISGEETSGGRREEDDDGLGEKEDDSDESDDSDDVGGGRGTLAVQTPTAPERRKPAPAASKKVTAARKAQLQKKKPERTAKADELRQATSKGRKGKGRQVVAQADVQAQHG